MLRDERDEHAVFLETAVEMANTMRHHMLGVPEAKRFDLVRKAIEENDVAFAVWNDLNAERGVGFRLIKGHQIARECIASNEGITARFAAIPCVDDAQAEALALECGDATSGLQ